LKQNVCLWLGSCKDGTKF